MTTPDEPAANAAARPRARGLLVVVFTIWIATFLISWGIAIAVAGWAVGGLLGWWPAATAASIMGLIAVAAVKHRQARRESAQAMEQAQP